MNRQRISRITKSLTTTAIFIVSCVLLADSLAAQGAGQPQIRFNGDGGPVPQPGGDPGGPPPRLPDGTPNLGRTEIGKGVWPRSLAPNYSEILVDPPRSPEITGARSAS